MNSGYGKIFWGLIFATFHINIGSLELLPTFIGLLMVLSGINEVNINRNYKTLKNSKIFCEILVGLSLVAGLNKLFYVGLLDNAMVNILWISGFAIIEVLMVYNLLEGSIEMLEEKCLSREADEYRGKIKIYLISEVIFVVINNIALVTMNDGMIFVAAFIAIVVRIWIIILMSRLKNI